MSKSVQRLTDLSLGHCYPPRSNVSASPDVFVNGLGAHRVSDYWPTHCCGDVCHDSTSIAGSQTVFVNGLALMRITDTLSCGESAGAGSPDVFCGD